MSPSDDTKGNNKKNIVTTMSEIDSGLFCEWVQSKRGENKVPKLDDLKKRQFERFYF